MTAPKWRTPKDLGVLENNAYVEVQLEATSGSGIVYYYHISGTMPEGIQLTLDGKLVGVPNVLTAETGERNYATKFTVRAQDDSGLVTDRTFNVLVSGIEPPTIYVTTTNLGTYEDGSYYKYQLIAVDPNPESRLSWRIVRGSLPPGITLNSMDGVLEGFFYQNKLDETAFARTGWDRTSWDRYIYDYVRRQQDLDFEFTVEVSDGINYTRQNYLIRVTGRDALTADTTQTYTDNQWVNVDVSPRHLPFILTMPQRLPEVKPELTRQGTWFAFKFDGVDYDEDPFYYEISSMDQLGFDQDGRLDPDGERRGTGFDMDGFDSSEHPMPPYLGIDNETGWYTGHLRSQLDHQVDYTFQIYARKRENFLLQGHRSTFVVSVLGQVDESITWITDSDLGTLDNGVVSGFKIEARSSTNKNIVYKIKYGDRSRTPQGIILLPNGMLSGRSTVEFFSLDGGDTTLDRASTTLDKVYNFTVKAEAEELRAGQLVTVAYSERTFKLTINQVNKKPFENLYLKGFPTTDQRALFASILNNQDIFPDQLIYRPDDPWFGKSLDLRFLFLPGINPTSLPDYVTAMGRNHYTKSVLFGDVKTAVCLDEKYNILYEVVYLDVIDEEEGKDPVTGQPKAPAQTINLDDRANFYTQDGISYTELTPNALGNMSTQLANTVGIANPNSLPQWMTCPQIDYNNPGEYTVPIGFVRAIVLAYTVPGASKLISYRLRNANFQFNRIPFRTDRYQLDNYLSKNYDIELERFLVGEVTHIDQAPSIAETYQYIGTVNYAVDAAYQDLMDVHINTVRENHLIDSYNDFVDGDTLIFMKPELFPSYMPGYYDQLMNGATNVRSAVYRININPVSHVVYLTIERYTDPGDIVDIKHGYLYGGKRFAFDSYLKHGSELIWWPFNKEPFYDAITGENLISQHRPTTFDHDTTRFVSNKDQYAGPETDAKYIKFPKIGVFI